MGGTGDGKFEPGIAVTRGMIAQMIYAMEGKPFVTVRKQFDDVAAGMWYTSAVEFVYANKIMGGYDEKTFGPEDFVSTASMTLPASPSGPSREWNGPWETGSSPDATAMSWHPRSAPPAPKWLRC